MTMSLVKSASAWFTQRRRKFHCTTQRCFIPFLNLSIFAPVPDGTKSYRGSLWDADGALALFHQPRDSFCFPHDSSFRPSLPPLPHPPASLLPIHCPPSPCASPPQLPSSA
ncbi:expressed unknown protein [Seminavis robusta]|uniref:Uncharacterized protein n=1 Tax=Seminavis robusta TaxID=568900 RepID=A0A9N8DBI5_9STRA|nr:expressed unknown protein [Seminavis robusta]|eukprot:Sro45_g026871.1  (111) ;mRNA; r:32877-33209